MPVKPFSPLLGFPVTFSRIGLGSLSATCLPLEAVCTPPNQKNTVKTP